MGKKILTFLRKPYLFIGFLALSIILAAVSAASGTCIYKPSGGIATGSRIGPGNINYFDVSSDGHIALNVKIGDMDGFICDADIASGRIADMIGEDVLSGYCHASSRYNVVMGENGDIWLHYVSWINNDAAINSEGILKIGADNRTVTMVGGISYSDAYDPPTREPRLTAFSHAGGALTFAYSDLEKASFYRIEDETGAQVITGEYIPDEDHFVVNVIPVSGGFLVVLSDGTVLRMGYEGGEGEVIYSSENGYAAISDTDTVCCAAELDGKLYVTAGCENDTLYILENGELKPAADIPLDDYDAVKVKRLVSAGGKLYLGLGNRIAVYDGSSVTPLDTAFEMPFFNALMSLLPLISLILAGIGIVFFVVFAIVSKHGLLFKQLLFMVPAMIVICVLICRQEGTEILETYLDQQISSISAVCDLCAGHLDGESIGEMLESGKWSAEQYVEIRDALLDEIGYNRGFWSDIYDIRLCVPDESDMALIFADTKKISKPFTEPDVSIDIATLDEYIVDDVSGMSVFESLEESGTFDMLFFGNTVDTVVAVEPIYDANDEICAYLVVSIDDFVFRAIQLDTISIILMAMVPYMIVLVLIISLICVAISIRIRKATRTVIKIADGDLTARIKNSSGDELGEICRQVNTMASNLEVIFDEKDKNEQFYYKFVPEKFRELLGKDKITDLALGDAESHEFSVLFCDIRSFSINSEMLTAKENFEFVNVIYGIAGPIIREYGGFVDKYIGDAVMALFESPDAAVEAGIKIYHSIVLDPFAAQRLNVRDINIGVGIHTGIARIGIVGEEERLSGTVISDTVNLSSRLESLTKIYHTAMIVSKDTIDRMKDPDSLNKRYIGMVQVAGVNDVTPLYEILDCLGDEEREKRTATKDDFKEAVRLFHLGRRAEAAEQLRKIQSTGKADHVVDMYCEYIEHLSEEDKGNVFRFVRK